MAIAIMFHVPDAGQEEYDAVMEKLGPVAPGRIYHVAGPSEEGWRVVDVWESPEAFEAFLTERLLPVARQVDQGFRARPAGPLTKTMRVLLTAAGRAGLQLSVGGASIRLRAPEEAAPILEALLRMPWEAAGRTGVRVLVVLDEFQALND